MRFVTGASLGLHLQRRDDAWCRFKSWIAVADVEFLDPAEIEVLKQLHELSFGFTKIRFLDRQSYLCPLVQSRRTSGDCDSVAIWARFRCVGLGSMHRPLLTPYP